LTSSLQELFLVYYVYVDSTAIPDRLRSIIDTNQKGMTIPAIVRGWTETYDLKDYYELLHMPTLLRLPVPISATWSISAQTPNGESQRFHYPQVRDSDQDSGFRDPDKENIDEEFLYPSNALPPWLLPERWIPADSLHGYRLRDVSKGRRDTLAANLIRHDKTIASVRFEQERYIPPSYWGLILTCGGGYLSYKGSTSGVAQVGAAYSPAIAILADVPLLDRLSAGVTYSSFLDNGSLRDLLSVSEGLSFSTTLKPYRLGTRKPFRYIEYVRVECGYVWGLRDALTSHGGLISVSLESGTIPLWFTYSGITIRPKFSWMFLEETMRGASVEIVIQ